MATPLRLGPPQSSVLSQRILTLTWNTRNLGVGVASEICIRMRVMKYVTSVGSLHLELIINIYRDSP